VADQLRLHGAPLRASGELLVERRLGSGGTGKLAVTQVPEDLLPLLPPLPQLPPLLHLLPLLPLPPLPQLPGRAGALLALGGPPHQPALALYWGVRGARPSTGRRPAARCAPRP